MTLQPEYFANNASTTLVGTINNSVTSITVSSAAGFPSNSQFRIIIDTEIMIVTAGAGTTTWTVTRGADGSTAASHTGGATVVQGLTTGNLPRATNLVYPYGTKEYGRPYIAKGEYSLVTGGNTITLLDTSSSNPNTPGYVDHIWIGTLNSFSFAAHQESVIKVYIDGNASPDMTFHWGLPTLAPFFGNNGAAWDGGRSALITSGSNDGDGHLKIKIPFTTSIKITLTCGETSPNTAKFFWDVSYKLTPNYSIDWGRCKRLQVNEIWNTAETPYSNVNIATVSGRGCIYGWTVVFKSAENNFNFLEGNPQIKIDGEVSPSMVWSGTEDFFLNGFYFSGGKQLAEDHGTAFMHNGTGNFNIGTYRWFLDDPIPFDTGFVFTWPCGDNTEATVLSSPTIFSGLWYYLDT